MALLNENRNKIPQVDIAPLAGTTPGKRGDLLMVKVDGNKDLYVCTTSSVSDTDGSGSTWNQKTITPI